MQNDEMTEIVAYLYDKVKYPTLVLIFLFVLSDIGGTYGFTKEIITDGSWVHIFIGLIGMYSLTTVWQFFCTGIAYKSGTNVYVATWGAISMFFFGDKTSRFVIEFQKVYEKEKGFALLLLGYPLSIIFDVVTDILYFQDSPWRHPVFLIIIGFSSIFTEQLSFMYGEMIITIKNNKSSSLLNKERGNKSGIF